MTKNRQQMLAVFVLPDGAPPVNERLNLQAFGKGTGDHVALLFRVSELKRTA